MTEAMPFLQKAILLSYDPRPFVRDIFCYNQPATRSPVMVCSTMLSMISRVMLPLR